MESFKNRVKFAVDKVGNATIMARKTGVTRQTISAYVSGDSDPTREKLVLLADAADIYTEWLATGRGPRDKDVLTAAHHEVQKQYRTAAQEEIKISDLLTKAAKVLESNSIYRPALAANINAFYHAISSEERMENIEKENRGLRSEMGDLKIRLAALEDKLSKGDQGGGQTADQEPLTRSLNGTTGT